MCANYYYLKNRKVFQLCTQIILISIQTCTYFKLNMYWLFPDTLIPVDLVLDLRFNSMHCVYAEECNYTKKKL